MEWIKKYWWIGLLFLVLPVVINFVLLIPAFTPIVGDNTIWLGFWGSYLGAIISASVAFIILVIQHKQNREENKRNRELQINVIKHQQEQSRLHHIIEISAKLMADADVSKYYTICRQIGNSMCNTADLVDGFSSNIEHYCNELDLYLNSGKERVDMIFMIRLKSLTSSYVEVLSEIKLLVRLFCNYKGDVNIPTLEELLLGSSQETSSVAKKYIDTKDYFLNYKDCRFIVNKFINLIDKKRLDMNDHIRDYISSEKVRINNILVEQKSEEKQNYE